MDAKTNELAGIAAAVAGHCQRCFSYHYREDICPRQRWGKKNGFIL